MISWLTQRVLNLAGFTLSRHQFVTLNRLRSGQAMQMCRISLPMGRDRITWLSLRRKPPDHNAHCWSVPTHCIPWRPATSTPSGSVRSAKVIKTVGGTVRMFQTPTRTIGCYREYAIAIEGEAGDSLTYNSSIDQSGFVRKERNVHCDVPVTYPSPLKTNTYCRSSGRRTLSVWRDRSDPDVAIKAYNIVYCWLCV